MTTLTWTLSLVGLMVVAVIVGLTLGRQDHAIGQGWAAFCAQRGRNVAAVLTMDNHIACVETR